MGFKVEKRDGIDEQKGEISGNKPVVYMVKQPYLRNEGIRQRVEERESHDVDGDSERAGLP